MSSPTPDSPSRTPRRRYNRKNHPIRTPGIQFPTSPPQIAELAFNIHGWALEDGLADSRQTYEVINAYRATMIKGGFKAKIDELLRKGDQPYRSDLAYTDRELDKGLADKDPAVARYLVVGYTLQERDPIYANNPKFDRPSDNELIGETPPSNNHLIAWNEVEAPILVVTPVKENTGTSIRLFGLISLRCGLCQPVLLQHDRVFYRWEFRASAGAKSAQRNKIWNQIAIEKAKEFTPHDQLLINQPETPSRSPRVPRIKRERRTSTISDETVVIKREDDDSLALAETAEVFELHLNLSVLFETTAERRGSYLIDDERIPVFANAKILLECESKSILSSIRQSRESNIAVQLEPILSVLGGRRDPLKHAHHLAVFCHPEIAVDIQDIHHVAYAITETWPELAILVDTASVFKIKQFLVHVRTPIAFDCLQDFLTKALTASRRYPSISSREFQYSIADACRTAVSNSVADAHTNAVIQHAANELSPDTNFMILLLRELVKFHDWQMQQEELIKSRPAPMTLVQSDFTYAITPETVVGKGISEVLACLQELIGFCQHRQGDIIADVVLWLDRLRLRIRQV